jgi:DNA primase large subunit
MINYKEEVKQWFDIEYKVYHFRNLIENHYKERSLLKNGKIRKNKMKLIDEMVEEHRQKLKGGDNER